jgi:hypothetical protein
MLQHMSAETDNAEGDSMAYSQTLGGGWGDVMEHKM